MRTARYIASALLICGMVACGAAAAEAPTQSATPVDPTAEVEHYQAVNTWNRAVHDNQVKAFYEAAYWQDIQRLTDAYEAQRAADQRAAAAAANAKRKSAAPTGRGGGGTVGGSCGGATNGADRFIGRESGGNANARNPSGAWGCYQIMPGTWASSCSDLGQHGSASTDAQAACASRLPSSSWSSSGPT